MLEKLLEMSIAGKFTNGGVATRWTGWTFPLHFSRGCSWDWCRSSGFFGGGSLSGLKFGPQTPLGLHLQTPWLGLLSSLHF